MKAPTDPIFESWMPVTARTLRVYMTCSRPQMAESRDSGTEDRRLIYDVCATVRAAKLSGPCLTN